MSLEEPIDPKSRLTTPIDPNYKLFELSVAVRSTSNKVQMALVAIAYPVDGSIGYVNPTFSEVPVDRWGRMRLIYDSPSNVILPALQFVIPSTETEEATVYIDNLQAAPYFMTEQKPMSILADSTFDSISDQLEGLNPNAVMPPNSVSGMVSMTEGLTGRGCRLQIEPDQLASHVVLYSVEPEMPCMIHGSILVKRESGVSGTLAFIITNGEQSAAYFLKAYHLPLGEFVRFRIGGNFELGGKSIPPLSVIQLGGPNVEGSMVIDNLELVTTK